MFEETRQYLKQIGMLQGDAFDMPSSSLRFPDGGAFPIEVPTVSQWLNGASIRFGPLLLLFCPDTQRMDANPAGQADSLFIFE